MSRRPFVIVALASAGIGLIGLLRSTLFAPPTAPVITAQVGEGGHAAPGATPRASPLPDDVARIAAELDRRANAQAVEPEPVAAAAQAEAAVASTDAALTALLAQLSADGTGHR